MAATIAGLTTLGITFGYGVESAGYAGEKPTSFTQLDRINSIDPITVTPATIDVSALEDYVTKYAAGRGETPGTWTIGVNATDETLTQWQNLIDAYKTAKESNLQMWFETIVPGITKGFFVIAQPPEVLPQPGAGQNEAFTMEIPLTIVDLKGMDTKVAFT